MRTKIHPAQALSGSYALRPIDSLSLEGTLRANIGVVRIAAGTRSPAEGLRINAKHEVAYIIAGEVRIETADGTRIAATGDVIVSSPTEAHATTAVTDAVLFFVLCDPVST